MTIAERIVRIDAEIIRLEERAWRKPLTSQEWQRYNDLIMLANELEKERRA